MKRELEIILQLGAEQIHGFEFDLGKPQIGCFLFLTGLTNSRFSHYGFFNPLYLWFYDPLLFSCWEKKRYLSSSEMYGRFIYIIGRFHRCLSAAIVLKWGL